MSGVLLVSNLFDRRPGSWGVCLELAERLPRCGWRVITTSGLRQRRLRPLDMLWTAWHRRSAYAVAHIDVFSGAAFRWAEAVGGLVQRLGKPLVLSLHGGNLPQFAAQQPQRIGRLLQRAQVVTAPSPYLREALGRWRADIQLLPNPIPIEQYTARLRTAVAPRLLWLRSFHHMYNPTLAVQLAAQLRLRYPDLRLTMVGFDRGDGSLGETQALVQAHGLDGHVALIGGVPKQVVPALLDTADIFLNTSRIDNTPISVLEACAAGLCIVTTNVGGLPYLLRDGEDALLVPPDDLPALTAAVERLLEQPETAQRLSAAARATAERYAWDAILPRWDTLLRGLAEVGR